MYTSQQVGVSFLNHSMNAYILLSVWGWALIHYSTAFLKNLRNWPGWASWCCSKYCSSYISAPCRVLKLKYIFSLCTHLNTGLPYACNTFQTAPDLTTKLCTVRLAATVYEAKKFCFIAPTITAVTQKLRKYHNHSVLLKHIQKPQTACLIPYKLAI